MNVPIFKLDYSDDEVNYFLQNAEEILRTGFVGEGKWVSRFEKEFGSLVSADNSIAVTSGTAAIDLCLRAVDVVDKEVLLPSNTFFATAVAVKNAGGIPVFVDCCRDDMAMDPDDLSLKITENTAAVVTVHIGGIISHRIFDILEICKNKSIPLIEDAAHAHLSTIDGYHAGTIGTAGCFSFFPTKVMTTGEGGMVTTNDSEFADKIRSLKNFGRDPNDMGTCLIPFGQNYKINEFTGLFGCLGCSRVMSRINKRNKLVKIYKQNLNPQRYNVVTQENGFCSYYKCIVQTPLHREIIKTKLNDNGISLTGEVYIKPVHKQPVFESGITLINTEWCSENHVCPPLYPELTEDEVVHICNVMNEII